MNRIRDLRLQKGWKQADLAKRINTTQQSVARYETGERGIDADTICQLCEVFGCTADYLLGRTLSRDGAMIDADELYDSSAEKGTLKGEGFYFVNPFVTANAPAVMNGEPVETVRTAAGGGGELGQRRDDGACGMRRRK